jgi:hypothetical protein
MLDYWSEWQRLSDFSLTTQAPQGAGIYEVRHAVSGRVIAFGSARKVADTLLNLPASNRISTRLMRLLGSQPSRVRAADLEFRTCAASDLEAAKGLATRLLGLRQRAWRKRAFQR